MLKKMAFFRPEEPRWRKRLLAAMLALFAFSLFDQATTIPLRGVEARIERFDHPHVVKTLMPHFYHDLTGGFTMIHFNHTPNWLDRWKGLMLVEKGCMDVVVANGVTLKLEKPYFEQDACGKPQQVRLDMMHKGDNQFSVMIRPWQGQRIHLELFRYPLLNKNHTVLLLLLGVYVLGLGWVPRGDARRKYHYVAGVLFLYAATVTEPYYSLESLRVVVLSVLPGVGLLYLTTRLMSIRAAQPLKAVLLAGLDKARDMPPVLFVGVCSGLFLLVAGALSQLLFDGLPHIADTHIQYVHAKIMAEGKLYDTSHPLKEFFDFQNAINNGKFFGTPFPGNVMLLAVGQWLGVPWLVNPLLGALTVIAVYLLALETTNRTTAYIAAALMLVSPMVMFMSAEYMNHVSCMLFLTLFCYGYFHQNRTKSLKTAALAGLMLGAGALVRLQAAAPFALLFALHALRQLKREPARIKPYAVMAAGFLLCMVWLGYYNLQTTGRPLVSAYQTMDYNNFYTSALSWKRVFSLGADLKRVMPQMLGVHREILGWAGSSFVFVLLMYLFRAQPRGTTLLFMPMAGVFLGLMFIYPDAGTVFYSRYAYEAMGSLLVVVAVSVAQLPKLLVGHMRLAQDISQAKAAAALSVLVLVVLAVPGIWQHRYNQYGNNYWEGHADYYEMIQRNVETPALVFMSVYEEFRLVYFAQPPRDENPIIFARYRGNENQKLMDYYPQRKVYVVHGWEVRRVR